MRKKLLMSLVLIPFLMGCQSLSHYHQNAWVAPAGTTEREKNIAFEECDLYGLAHSDNPFTQIQITHKCMLAKGYKPR